ncbi:hypothetical protein MTR67_003750 [Solanum verrucosum]|uniref:Uncharacterized protein n=1 Tax=Solanum verrucosum TaxID=315347 RepID=A0AAF0PW91_SOLVR|nr:hypothetical protein MTR67_003750 [Solanum verrucosum]
MEEIVFTKIYHGGILFEIFVPTYVGNYVPALKYIIKDHFSILELLYYTKELGYETVGCFFVKDLLNKKWVLITTDQHLLHLIKDLKHEDTFEVFVCHILDEPLLDTEGPRGYLTNVGGEGVDVDLGEGEDVDLSGEGEVVYLSGESVDVNIGEEGEDVNLCGEGVDDNLGGKGESDFLSSDSDLDILSEDGSDIDEELRAFRQERRNKKQRKKATEFEEISIGEAGGIDRDFEDIVKNKTDKYAGKLGGDEDYIDSSVCWSDDSDEQLDINVIRGVDIPARRRSKKVRYDEDCEVSVFELGMVFEGVNQFRKAVADYVVEAKQRIMKEDIGDWNVEFARLCDYADMIKQTNPGSSCWVRTQSSQQSFVCADTIVVPRTTQTTSTMRGPSHSTFRTTYATTQSSQPSSICADTTSEPRPPQNRVQVGTGRGLGRKKTNARGTPFVTERDSSSSQLPLLSVHKRPYSSTSFVAATRENRRPATGFGVYSNPTIGAQVFNPGTSSEKILHGPTKLKSVSPTNIDIGFKPRGLKWKGKDAVGTSQLQQMKANRKN